MIRYALKCGNEHSFESWFKSADAFDSLQGKGAVVCPFCDDKNIEKTLMAPPVRASKKRAASEALPQTVTNAPDPQIVEAIRSIRDHVERTSDYVGDRFATEARAMHEGEMPHRPIYGEARPEDAKKLKEDGVPALPLPFIPKQKSN